MVRARYYALIATVLWLIVPGRSVLAQAIGGSEAMDRPSARPLAPPDYAPNAEPESFELPSIPQTVIDHSQAQTSLFISHIILKGHTAFTEQELRTLTQNYEARAVSLSELEDLRQQITRYYIDHGYVNSGAIIATDAYRDGELSIDIVEGRIDEIRLKGLERLREGYVKNRLIEDKEHPFNLNELQERFQLLLADPLIERMNGRILPGATPGRGILDIDVTRARPYQLTLFGNNQRPPSIGAEAFGLTAQVYNLTGLGDALDFSFITSEGSERYSGGFSVPITDSGMKVFFRFDEGDSMVIEEPISTIDINSRVHSLEGGISQVLFNTLTQHLTVGALLTIRENETSLLGRPFSFIPGETTGRNQATVWRLFQDYLHRWEHHALALRSTLSVGMNALGATAERDRAHPDSEFFAWLGQAQYAWRLLDNGAQIVLRGNAQFSDEPLLPLERMAVGGFYTVRGYRENQLVRDQGYSLSAEFRYPLFGAESNARHRLTLVPFMDYGEAWNHGESSEALHSVGIGAEWQFKPLRAAFYYGYAINRPTVKQNDNIQDDGLHFQVQLDVFDLF